MIDNYIVRRPKVRWNACFDLKATVYEIIVATNLCTSQKEGKIVGKKRGRYEIFVDIGNANGKVTTRQATRHTDCREQYVL